MKALARTLLVGAAVLIAGYVGWGRVEAYRLAAGIKAIAARGEPVDLSALDTPLPTPRHEESARLYAEAAARAREIGQQDYRMMRFDVDAVVGHVDVADAEATYKRDAPALQLLDRAATLPFAGFGDEAEGPDWMLTQGLQSLGALAALRADLLAYRGDGDGAARALVAALAVPRTLPETFNRYALGNRQFGSLRILLRHSVPSPAALEALQRAFASLPDEDGLDRALMLRRARLIEDQANGLGPGGVSGTAAFLFQPFLTRTLRVQIEQFPEVIAAARQPWPDKFAMLSTLAATSGPRGNRDPIRGALRGDMPNLAALSSAPGPAGLSLAARRVAVTTLAIERYRRAHATLPPSLDALVPAFLPAVPIDPFSGRPVVFKAAPDSYLVYSFDVNRMDDGGALYGAGSRNPMPLPKIRDFGVKVPLAPRPVRQ